MTDTLQAIERPNGRWYRPRKVIAHPIDAYGDDECTSVVVFGTHDVARAQVLADELVRSYVDSRFVAVDPKLVWWRDGMRDGQRVFEDDSEHGRAGVYFANIDEA